MRKNITPQTLQRLPMYLNYLKSLPKNSGNVNISATAIAEALNLNDVQVRKDLASVSKGGKPKVGYVTEELIGDIGQFLGFENKTGVIIAGVGNLGRALLAFDGFGDYGLNILAGFDENKDIAGTEINGKPVFSVSELKAFCKKGKRKNRYNNRAGECCSGNMRYNGVQRDHSNNEFCSGTSYCSGKCYHKK